MEMHFLFVIGFISCVKICTADIYVSTLSTTTDTSGCGAVNRPCIRLETAIRLSNIMGETIKLMTFESDKQNIYEVSNQLLIDRDIRIMTAPSWQSNRKRAVIRVAPNSYVNQVFRFVNGSARRFNNEPPRLRLTSISFTDSSVVDFEQHNGILEIEDCHIGNVQRSVVTGQFNKLTQAFIRINRTVFENCGSIVNILDISLKPHFNVDLDFSMTLTDSVVSGTTDYAHPTAGVLINVANKIKRFNLTVARTQFLYLTQALLVHTNQTTDVRFQVSNSVFRHNFLIRNTKSGDVDLFTDCIYCMLLCGGAIKYSGKGHLNITDTLFVNNTAKKGGAICLDGPDGFFNNVTFNENKAVEYGGAIFIYSSQARISSATFMLNTASWKVRDTEDHSSGIGGALYCKGDVTVTRSQFVHNSASLFGGSILHDGERLKLISNIFVGPKFYEDTSLHGSILYTKTQSTLIDNKFYSVSANSQGSVIFHSSDDVELAIKPPFSLTCKRGEKLVRSFNHQPKRTEFSLLMFICKPCNDGQYSLQQETVSLNASHMESDVLVNCKNCPQGGVCKNGIKSLPNFWGWKTLDKKDIKFLPCPSSTYCCSLGACVSYDSCDLNREGQLCGRCREGYGESLLASVCVPNESCNGSFLWPFVVIIGFCYVVLLLYFKDIFSYVKLLVLKPIVFIQKLQTVAHTTDLDDLDNFYVDLGNTDENVDGLVIRHDMPPDIIENDESSIMRPDEDLDGDSVNESGESLYYSADEEYHSHPTTERLISGDNNTATISTLARTRTTSTLTTTNAIKITSTLQRSKGKKIKWYSYLFGIFKIIVFFYQMQLLSKVPSVLESSYEFEGPRFLKEFVTGIFNLKLTGSYFSFHLCMIKDLEPIFKRFLKILFVVSLFVLLALFYLVCKLFLRLKAICSTSWRDGEHEEQRHRLPLSIRVKCCIVQIFLLGFSTITTASFELLHCVPINGVYYSYINGTAECNRGWYELAKALTICWTVPFVIALFFANKLLREEKVHLSEFLFMLFFPPSFLYYTVRNVFRNDRKTRYTGDEMQAREHVLQVLEMPFKKKDTLKSIWYWETMLITRRLILISIFVFFPEPISRLYVMFIPLTLFLVDHLRVQPYNSRLLNWLETVSLLGLVFLISINLYWAYNYETNVPVNDSLDLISHTFLYVETFILLLPLLIIIIVIVVAAVGTMLKKVRRKREESKGR